MQGILFGSFEMQNGTYFVENEKYGTFENENYIAAVYGRIVTDGQVNDYGRILKLYEQYGNEIVNYLEGIYFLVIFDRNRKEAVVYQDYNSAEIFYYTVKNGHTVYFSNSLKRLLLESQIEREMDDSAKIYFINQGFIPGEETLLRNVKKLKSFCALYLGSDIRQIWLEYTFGVLSEEEGKKKWSETLNRSIGLDVQDTDKVCIPISSGYDSNYILYYLNEYTDKDISMFSVGGSSGVDETGIVEKNIKVYDLARNHLTVGYTDPKMLQELPDIVWRLEGSTFEHGIFLQYCLAAMAAEAGKEVMVCGEGANEVMHVNYNRSSKSPRDTFIAERLTKHPYEYLANIILKKSAVMLNSFGIEGRYPFVNQKFMGVAAAVQNLNQTEKLYHRQVCHEVLDEKIIKNIIVVGGNTSLRSLFRNSAEVEGFLKFVENSELYKEVQPEIARRRAGKGETKADAVKSVMKSFGSRVIAKLRTHKLRDLSPKHLKEAKRLNKDMAYMYVIVFEKLFASEKTAEYLKNGLADTKLKDIIEF